MLLLNITIVTMPLFVSFYKLQTRLVLIGFFYSIHVELLFFWNNWLPSIRWISLLELNKKVGTYSKLFLIPHIYCCIPMTIRVSTLCLTVTKDPAAAEVWLRHLSVCLLLWLSSTSLKRKWVIKSFNHQFTDMGRAGNFS